MEVYQLIYNLLNTKGVGRVKANKILQYISEPLKNNILDINYLYDILCNQFTKDIVSEILNNTINISMKENYPSVFYLNRFQKEFPSSLQNMKLDCPPLLSCIGNIELLKSTKIGFCGSRKATQKGLDVAIDIVQQISLKDIVVVSGYASGVDQTTHYWALKEGGRTIIVLPEGIQGFTIKKVLKDVWDWNRVLVISEFSPNAIWSINRAMQRNTTIVSLSDVMVLIEAKEKGGSIDAGYKTLQMNKKLFAPIYEGMPDEASGNNLLLNKGALPIKKKRNTDRANLENLMNILQIVSNTRTSLF